MVRATGDGRGTWVQLPQDCMEAHSPLYYRACPLGFGFDEGVVDGVIEDAVRQGEQGASADGWSGVEALAGGGDVPVSRDLMRAEAVSPARSVIEVQQFLVSQMGEINRRMADVCEGQQHRTHENRRESYMLIFAMSAILVFCCVAFFLHQIEMRDLHTGLEEQIDRQEGHTRHNLERRIDGLTAKHLPKMFSVLNHRLDSMESSRQKARAELVAEMGQRSESSRRQYDEVLRLLGDRIGRLQDELRQVQQSGASPADGPVDEVVASGQVGS